MADNCSPELQNPLNYQSEEKPYYNSSEASDLIIQNNQPNSFPNQNNYTNNQIPNPGYNINNSSADEQSNCMNNMNNNVDNNNNIQNEPQVPENKLRIQIIIAILLFIYVIIDIVLQILFRFVNIISMVDDLVILIIASIISICSCRKKAAKNPCLKYFVIFMWVVGFVGKLYAIELYNDRDYSIRIIYIIYIIFIFIRTGILSYYINAVLM